jgi:hypothetical protein
MTKFENGWVIYLLAYEDGTECSETSAYKFRRRGITLKKTYNKDAICLLKDMKMR